MRRFVCSLALLLPLAGCALPKLPSLPTIGQIKDAVVATSEGDTAKDAVSQASTFAASWAPDALLVAVRGSKIDTGGRDHGLAGGQWLVEYQSASKALKYSVRIQYNQKPTTSEAPAEAGQTPLEQTLAGLLDSPDAVAKAGLGAKSYAVILRGSADGARYEVLGEGAGTATTLDARTGAKI